MGTLKMAGNDMDVEVINWCLFVPLRGPRGVRHVAPDGEDFCKKHQRDMEKREETIQNKRKKEQQDERMKALENQAKRASAVEYQHYIDQEFKEYERNLEQKFKERYQTYGNGPEPVPVRRNPQRNVDMQPVPPPIAPVVSEDEILQRVKAAVAIVLQQLPITPAVSEDVITQRVNTAVADALRRAGYGSTAASESTYTSQPVKSSSRSYVSSRSSHRRSPVVSRKSSYSDVSLPSSQVSSRSSRPAIPARALASSCIRSTRSSIGYSEDDGDYEYDVPNDDGDFIEYESDDSIASLSSRFSRSRID